MCLRLQKTDLSSQENLIQVFCFQKTFMCRRFLKTHRVSGQFYFYRQTFYSKCLSSVGILKRYFVIQLFASLQRTYKNIKKFWRDICCKIQKTKKTSGDILQKGFQEGFYKILLVGLRAALLFEFSYFCLCQTVEDRYFFTRNFSSP